MSVTRLVRGLRRVVDSLQRGLFDDAEPAPIGAAPPSPSAVDRRPPPTARAPIRCRAIRGRRASSSLDGRAIAFAVRALARRSIGFVVDGDGLSVRAPKWVEPARRRRGGAREGPLDPRPARRAARARAPAGRGGASSGATARAIAYLGRPLTIVLDPHGDARRRRGGARSTATAPRARRRAARRPAAATPARSAIRDAVQSWLQREARRVFAARAAHFAERLGVRGQAARRCRRRRRAGAAPTPTARCACTGA